jgi:thiol:disulfide interchange protein DsbD
MNDLAGPRICGRLLAVLALTFGAAAVSAADLPAPSQASRPANGIDAVLASSRLKSNDGDFLPPDVAFRFAAVADGPDRVRLIWQIADGYYLYRARIKVETSSDRAQVGTLAMPTGKVKQDEYFGRQEIYHGELTATLPVARSGGSAFELPLKVTYQGCAEAGICYPPIVKTVDVSLPGAGAGGSATPGAALPGNPAAAPGASAANPAATPGASAATSATPGVAAAQGAATLNAKAAGGSAAFVSEQDNYAAVLRDSNILWVVLSFLGTGILLSFTPCVLPMVPIVSGIIIGDGTNLTVRRTFTLSLTYVLGMALTYTAAGIAVAAGGQQVQAAFQQPWIIVLFAAMFVVLALSMFGLFTLQMPAALQTRLASMSNRQSAGSYGGVAVMGALSALIVTTCVAPALVGALLFIGQSGNLVRGGLALFAMGLGMGAPLLVVGASAGKLLPRAGAWMDLVKRLFGALMLAVAAWMLERIVPDRFSLVLWIAPAVAAAVVLWTGARGLRGSVTLVRFAAAAASAYAGVLVAGAIMGATNPLSPLTRGSISTRHDLPFRTIKSVADLQREVADAKSRGQGVLLDFYADWCVSCKEMERYTFTDSAVQSALHGTVLLRANVTDNDADDQALLRHFGIFGPPTIALYGTDGQERRNFRVVGYMKAADFATLLHQALASSAAAAPTPAAPTPAAPTPVVSTPAVSTPAATKESTARASSDADHYPPST